MLELLQAMIVSGSSNRKGSAARADPSVQSQLPMSRNASGGSSTGTPTLQCYASPLFHKLAHEAAAASGISTSGLLRLALVDYISRLGLRHGLAEELRVKLWPEGPIG